MPNLAAIIARIFDVGFSNGRFGNRQPALWKHARSWPIRGAQEPHDLLNTRLSRSKFMPFAPAITAEKAQHCLSIRLTGTPVDS
jgi:hypothetical protein